MIRRFSVAITVVFSLCLMVFAGFQSETADEAAVPACSLEPEISSCDWGGDSELEDAFGGNSVDYFAETHFDAQGNFDHRLYVYVYTKVRRGSTTLATKSKSKTCWGCDGTPALDVSVDGTVNACSGAGGVSTVYVWQNSTHKVEVLTGGGSATFSTSDFESYHCE